MVQTARYFDSLLYTEAEYAEVQNRLLPEGIIRDIGGQMAVSAPGGMVVRIAAGEAMEQGFWYKNTANLDLAVSANVSGSARTDAVTLRLNRVTNTVQLLLVTNAPGTPIRTPGGDWEMRIATIVVPNGAAAITAGMITDTRTGIYCGYTKNGGFYAGTSRSSVGVYVGSDIDTGIWWPAENQIEIVAGANPALIVQGPATFLGTASTNTSIQIGRSTVTTAVTGGLTVSELATFVGSAVQVHPTTGQSLLSIAAVDGSPNWIRMGNTAATKLVDIVLGTAAAQGIGGSGDFSLYTGGSGGGRVLFGVNVSARLILQSDGVRFMNGATQLGFINTSGNMVIGDDAAPASRFQVTTNGAGTGIVVAAPSFVSGASPMVALHETPSSPTRGAQMGLALSAGHFGATLVGDFFIFTHGSNAGRLALGQAQKLTLMMDTTGGVKILQNTTDSSATGLKIVGAAGGVDGYVYLDSSGRFVLGRRGPTAFFHVHPTTGYITIGTAASDAAFFHLSQPGNTSTDGIKLTNGGADGRIWTDVAGLLRFTAFNNTGVSLVHNSANFVPGANVDQSCSLGSSGIRWTWLYCMGATFASTVTIAAGGIAVTGASTIAGTLSSISTLTATTVNASTVTATSNVTGADARFDSGRIWCNSFSMQFTGGTLSNFMHLGVNSAGKPTNGTWDVISDPRSKRPDAYRPYEVGLTDILMMTPEWFKYNGEFGTPDGDEGVGIRVEYLKETRATRMVIPKRRIVTEDVEDSDGGPMRSMQRMIDVDDDDEGAPFQVNYHELPLALVNASHDLYAMIQEMRREINDLRREVHSRRN